MAKKDLITGLEQEEIKVETPELTPLESEPGATNSVVNLEGLGTNQGPLGTIDIPKSEDFFGAGKTVGTSITGGDIKSPIGTDTPKIDAPKVDIPGGKITGIEQIDTELDKLKTEKEESITDTFDSFNLARGEFERNKNLYTNFDEVNTQFDNALSDMRKIQQEQGITDLTDEQLQIIANNNGLSLEEVKDPTSIFNKLSPTEEGEKELGITSAEAQIDKFTTDFERGKEDIAFNLEGQKAQLNNQLEDVKIQLARNIAFAEAQGAFTGGLRSSGFEQGIQNIRSDGERVISRLEDQLERVEGASAENLARLTDDYTLATTQAKDSLDRQLKDLKFDVGLELNGLEGKFGIGTDELTKALDKINEEFGTKSMKVFGDYVTNMRNIQQITNDNIIQQEKINTLTQGRIDKRFNELIANDGILLQNTSLQTLTQNLKDGTITQQRFNDLKGLMESSIINTLNDIGTVSTSDIKTIKSLLNSGMNPQQIVASMQGLDRFKAKKTVLETIKVGDSTLVKYSDGTEEVLTEDELKKRIPTTITPSGSIVGVEFTTPGGKDKTINVDQKAQASLENLIKTMQLEVEGGDQVTIADGFRTRERQQELFDAGKGLVAEPGTSKHETGLAIDIYSNQNLDALTPEQVKVMNNNGWFQTAGEEDLGHFEYKGTPGIEGGELTASQKLQANALAGRMKGSKKASEVEKRRDQIETEMKAGKSIDDIEDDIRTGAFGSEFTGNLKSSFENLSVKGFTTEQKIAYQNALEDKIKEFGADSSQVKSFLKRLAVASLDADGAKKVRGYETLEKTMGDIKDDLLAYEKAGGKTSIFAGKTEGLLKRVGNVDDPELRKIATKIAKAIQVYRQGVSGAAFTESESQEYKNIFPSIDNISALNTQLIDAVLESNTISLDSAYSQQMGADEYNAIFKTETPVELDTTETGETDLFDKYF